jgi:23S rRNA (pseudouridine1915-N3)-methyltransferase
VTRLAVVAAGKLRDAGLQALCDEYLRRARAFAPLELVEVRDAAALRSHGLQDRSRGTGPGGQVLRVLLDERGEQPSTREFAGWISQWRDQGVRAAQFHIGDADGFRDVDRAGADRLLSLSRMTLPHRLARLVLLEQLYRALSLIAGHPYHHD